MTAAETTTATKTADKSPQERIAGLQAEASALPAQIEQAAQESNANEYLRLQVRQSALPRELRQAQIEAKEAEIEELRQRKYRVAAAEPQLRATRDKAERRMKEIIARAEAEFQEADTALFANLSEGRQLANSDELSVLTRELQALRGETR